ncbi:MAG: hypothetical protein GY810_18055 [Aureispira sp.]|nr:hypothetical protein [Aureispira sp.]
MTIMMMMTIMVRAKTSTKTMTMLKERIRNILEKVMPMEKIKEIYQVKNLDKLVLKLLAKKQKKLRRM